MIRKVSEATEKYLHIPTQREIAAREIMTGENDYVGQNRIGEQNDYIGNMNTNFSFEDGSSEVSDSEVHLTEASVQLESAIEAAEDEDVQREAIRGFRHVLKALTMDQEGESNGG